MRVLLLYNPIAGSGMAADAAERLHRLLDEAGHDPVLTATEPPPSEPWLVPALEGVRALIVLGGDGAIRMASGAASRTDTPVYAFPFGTENLFAREFGFDRSPRRLLDALERFEVRHVDSATVGEENFLLMASIGPDACAVRELAARRGGGISHLSYAAPLLRQLSGWRAPRLSVRIDDEPVVPEQRGLVIVANSRQYALRFDPALRASMTDGKLDVVFCPCRSAFGALLWMIACRLRLQTRRSRCVYGTGRRVLVHSAPEHAFQIDGDAPVSGSPATDLDIRVRPASVPVLIPR